MLDRARWPLLSLMIMLPSLAAAQPAEEVPAVMIDTGCTGGVTGGGNGVTMAANGHLIAWAQTTAGAPRVQTDLGVDKAAAIELIGALAIDFSEIEFDERGSMTCSLTYRGHTVAWPIGDAEVPAAVVDIHERLVARAAD